MTATDKTNIDAEISGLPSVLQDAARRWFERFSLQHAAWSESGVDIATLVRLIASSEFAGSVLLREWNWLVGLHERRAIDQAPDLHSIRLQADEIDAADPAELKSRLRIFRNQQLLHILWRSVKARNSYDSLAESLASLSGLADALICTSVRLAEALLAPRFGTPQSREENRQKIPLIAVAMGKLGGGELNFSSDVDLIFLYPEDGETDGSARLSAHEYFTRLARQAISLLDEVTQDGFVYRVDTRLRPFGESGPPVVSFAALEAYLLQHGRSWERYAYIKARTITPVSTDASVVELNHDMIEPFVYRRYLDYGVFESLRNMKSLVATEVRRRDLADNIKLGPGGIREIEFIVQSLQLVRGGNDEQLRCRELQIVLPELGKGKGLSPAAVRSLSVAYNFLRRLENAIQAIRDQQTHDLPGEAIDQARLLVALDCPDWDSLTKELAGHRATVSQLFAEIAFRSDADGTQSELAKSLAGLWEAEPAQDVWAEFLAQNGYANADELATTINEFSHAPIHHQIDATATRRLRQFVPALLILLQDRPHPQLVCDRVFNVATRILRRSAYIALLNENPASMRHLVMLCEQSAYLADEIARFPLLLDEMLDPRPYSKNITAAGMREDLMQRMERSAAADSEQRIEVLARFQRASLFRIAIADFGANLPIMQVSDRLTDLAEIVLHYALEVAWSDLVKKHGVPQFTGEHGVQSAGLGVIAYGKLGGMELSYRSDLDLVFLHDSTGNLQQTDGSNSLENSMFFARVARRLVHFLTTQTGSGALYEVDTRLRPSGRSGLLVVSVEGFEKYQDENAWTWEHQALLRSRPVAGSGGVAREFERIRSETLRNRVRCDELLDEVLSMRAKMRKQLDKSSDGRFDLKQGEGGIGDIEFLVQYLVLKNARSNPAVIHYQDNIRQLGALGAAGFLAPETACQLQESYRAYRLCLHRLSLNGALPLVAADDFVAEREFVVLAWQQEMR